MSRGIRCARAVIEVAKSRGLELFVKPGPPAMPYLRVPPELMHLKDRLVTPTLMEALKTWRVEIIEELTQER